MPLSLVQSLDLGAHLHTQLHVQVTERPSNVRFIDALARPMATQQLALPTEKFGLGDVPARLDLQHGGYFADALVALRQLCASQAKPMLPYYRSSWGTGRSSGNTMANVALGRWHRPRRAGDQPFQSLWVFQANDVEQRWYLAAALARTR